MWPDRVSNPGPLTYESGALPIALRGPAHTARIGLCLYLFKNNRIQKLIKINSLSKTKIQNFEETGFTLLNYEICDKSMK